MVSSACRRLAVPSIIASNAPWLRSFNVINHSLALMAGFILSITHPIGFSSLAIGRYLLRLRMLPPYTWAFYVTLTDYGSNTVAVYEKPQRFRRASHSLFLHVQPFTFFQVLKVIAFALKSSQRIGCKLRPRIHVVSSFHDTGYSGSTMPAISFPNS
jgi:hypothetical protein